MSVVGNARPTQSKATSFQVLFIDMYGDCMKLSLPPPRPTLSLI